LTPEKFNTVGDLGKQLEDPFLSMLAYVAEQERKTAMELTDQKLVGTLLKCNYYNKLTF